MLDPLMEAFEACIQRQVKLLLNKQEMERAREMTRSVMRAAASVAKVGDTTEHAKLHEWLVKYREHE